MPPTSYRDLTWEVIELNQKLTNLFQMVIQTKESTPARNTRTLQKLDHWLTQLKYIMDSLTRIESSLESHLSGVFNVDLNRNELLFVIMFQPSTKNLFLEIEAHYRGKMGAVLDADDLNLLIALSEMAQVLALVGDASIDMAVLHHLWQPRVADVGLLTQERAKFVSNEHLAQKCDEWSLYEHRIHFDPPSVSKTEMEHDKGTLVEGVFGIIYVEYGFDKVREQIQSIL
ncbi:MAG: ribonuclease III domain-containing protein [Candidatus Thorarchaeota archaeon]|jgi:ribonuclease-3